MVSFKNALLIMSLFVVLMVTLSAGSSANPVSPNIPLDSPVYTIIDKLDGLGYLKEMQNGTKPYARMQVAGWVKTIREKIPAETSQPVYLQTILKQLETEFAPEIAVLNGTASNQGFTFREWNVSGVYYDGEPLAQHGTSSTYQPMVINNNGYKLADGLNVIGSARADGVWGDAFLFSLTPRLDLEEDDVDLSLESGYVKTRYKNLEIQLGKDPMWWGQGERGTLTLTNNMRPLTSLQLSSLEPIQFDGLFRFLKEMELTAVYADLEDERDVNSPAYFGLRSAITPAANFTLGMSLNAMVGGEGHELHLSDLLDFIIGKNAETAQIDKWNTIAGWDFRWRIPRLRGLQVYGNYYGEDQKTHPIPLPYKTAYIYGFYLPRLTVDGSWELQVENAKTTNVWYNHSLYTDGYTYHDNLMGDAMGYNANRQFLKVAHYLEDGSCLAFQAERLEMDDELAYAQTVSSFWVSYRTEWKDDVTLSVTAGLADIDYLNFQADQSERDYLVSVGLGKRF